MRHGQKLLLNCRSVNMQLDYLAKMETHNSQRDSQGEQPGTAEQGPEKEPPIVGPLDAADTQLINRPPQSQDILRVPLGSDSARLILAKKCYNALIIIFGRVDLA